MSATDPNAARNRQQRGHVRAARADQLHRFLVGCGGSSLELLQTGDVPGFSRAEVHNAVDDLVEAGRATVEVGYSGYQIFIEAIVPDEPDIAEAA